METLSRKQRSYYGSKFDSSKFDLSFPSGLTSTIPLGGFGPYDLNGGTQVEHNSKDRLKNYIEINAEKRDHIVYNKRKSSEQKNPNVITFDDDEQPAENSNIEETDSDYDSNLDTDSETAPETISSDSAEDSMYNKSSSAVTNESSSLYESSADDTVEEEDTEILKRVYTDKDGNKYEKMYDSDDGNHERYINEQYKKYRKSQGPLPEELSTSCEAYTDSDDDDTHTDTSNMDKIDLDDAPDTEESDDFEDSSLMDPIPVPRKRPPDHIPRGIPDPYAKPDPLAWLTGQKETARCLLGSTVEQLENGKAPNVMSPFPSTLVGGFKTFLQSALKSTISTVFPHQPLPGDNATVSSEDGPSKSPISVPSETETPPPFNSFLLPFNRIS